MLPAAAADWLCCYSEAAKAAVDAIELEGGLEAVKEKIRLLQSLLDWNRIAIVGCEFEQPGYRPGEGYFEDIAEFDCLGNQSTVFPCLIEWNISEKKHPMKFKAIQVLHPQMEPIIISFECWQYKTNQS